MRLRLPPLIVALAFTLAPVAHAGIAPRIVGGAPSAAGAHPFMAALVVPGFANDADGTFCGATVIAPYAFLTAAHCIVQPSQTLDPSGLIVVTGKTDLFLAGGQHLAVRKLVTHPGFGSPAALSNDLAVVLTTTPTTSAAIARDTVTPVAGDSGTALGWGATDVSPALPLTFPAKLQEATLPIQTAGKCVDPGVICAGLTTPNICIGDSGGPLLVTRGGVTRQAGIASSILTASATTPQCGIDLSSSQFMNVSLYTAWIDAQLAPAVSGVAVSAAAGGKLHVAWQRTPGGAEPSVVVATSDGTSRSAPTGSTSLDIAGLPLRTALSATVSVTNAWGTAKAASAGTATLVGAPSISNLAATAAKIAGQVATNGVASSVKAEYGLDAAHLTTTAATSLPDAAASAPVSFPLAALAAGRTYRARLIAQNAAGTTVSPWVAFTTPATRPVSTAKPKISGRPRVGRTLTCAPGTWKAAPAPSYSFAWRIGGKVSRTQKKSTLKLAKSMLAKSISCVVTAKNPAASVTVRSAAVTVRRR